MLGMQLDIRQFMANLDNLTGLCFTTLATIQNPDYTIPTGL